MKIKDLLLALLILMVTTTHSQKVNIIPQPNEMNLQRGYFTFTRLLIHTNSKSQATAKYLLQELKKISRKSYYIRLNEQPSSNYISFNENTNLSKEAYELRIADNGISITAAGPTGWFYGSQSLLQIFTQYEKNRGQTTSLPKLTIKDQPAFQWRAYMLDEARYFKGAQQVKLLLDEMAYLKMNVFHGELKLKNTHYSQRLGQNEKALKLVQNNGKAQYSRANPMKGFIPKKK